MSITSRWHLALLILGLSLFYKVMDFLIFRVILVLESTHSLKHLVSLGMGLRQCVKGQCTPRRTWQQWLLQDSQLASVGSVYGCLVLGNPGRRKGKKKKKDCSRVSLYCCKSLICRPNETWELPRIPGGPCPLRAFTLSEQSIYLVSGILTTNQTLPAVYMWVQSPFHFCPICGIWFIVII